MIPDDEWYVLEHDILWVNMNLGRLSDKERPFIEDLAQQVAEYGQFMHMTTRQLEWFRRILAKVDGDDACDA